MEKDLLSAVVLAGGKSTRMGTDKAFLPYNQKSFIALIAEELLKVTDDIVLTIGEKDKKVFESVLGNDRKIKLVQDIQYLENPLGGMISAFESVQGKYAMVVACDSPLIRIDLVKYLYSEALDHSAAIPVWNELEPFNCEPLCGVYNVRESKTGILRAIKLESMGCKRMLSYLSDVRYIPVSDLRRFDPGLVSLLNVNTQRDYEEMVARCQIPLLRLKQ